MSHETSKVQQLQTYLSVNKFDKALLISNDLLVDAPDNPSYIAMRGIVLQNLNRSQEAVLAYEEAISKGGEPGHLQYLIGDTKFDMKDFAGSELALLEAIRIDPQNAKAIATYGYINFLNGNKNKAYQLIDNALEIDPGNGTAIQYRYQMFLSKKSRANQGQALSRIIQNGTTETVILVNAGMMELFGGRYRSAKENFRQAFLLEPTNESILSILKELDLATNPFFIPHRLTDKVGPGLMWVAMIVMVMGLRLLGYGDAALVVALVYVGIALYTWSVTLIYKVIVKIRKR